MQIAQPRRQRANRIEPRGAQHKTTQLITWCSLRFQVNAHMQPPIGLATATLRQRTRRRCRTRETLHPRQRGPLTGLPITHTQRPPGRAVKHRVTGPQTQIRIVKQQSHRNAAQLGALVLAQLFIQRMVDPAIAPLHLAGDGELVIFLRQPLAVSLHHLPNRNPANDRRRQCQTFEHDDSFHRHKKKRTCTVVVQVRCGLVDGIYCCTKNRRLPGFVSW